MSQSSTYEQITVGAAAVGLAAATTGGSNQTTPQMNRFTCRVESAQVRYRTDGVPPTTTVGTILDVGDILTIDTSEDAKRVLFIRTGAVSGLVNVEGFQS